MNVKKVIDIEEAAKENYTQSEPWPNNDMWHTCTYNILNKYVQSIWMNYILVPLRLF